MSNAKVRHSDRPSYAYPNPSIAGGDVHIEQDKDEERDEATIREEIREAIERVRGEDVEAAVEAEQYRENGVRDD